MATASQDAMTSLTAQWYNAVTTACNLDPSSFQLFQGNSPLQATSEGIWSILDVVPPLSVNNLYNPSQANVFSTNYGAVIMNLRVPVNGTFAQAMGDHLDAWFAYVKTAPDQPVLELLERWTARNMLPQQARAAVTAYKQSLNETVEAAVDKYHAAQGVYAYNRTIDDARAGIQSSPGVSFTMDSLTESTNISHTWAQGRVRAADDFFWGEAQAQYEKITVALYSAGIQVAVKFKHLYTLAAGPLARSSGPLSNAKPWYSSAALSLAYSNPNNNNVWQNTPPDWANAFGPDGNMQRLCSALVLVDGIEITTTSSVGIPSSEQADFAGGVVAGVYPMFVVSGSGGWSNTVSFNDSGQMTVTTRCNEGNPQVLGALVTPMDRAIAFFETPPAQEEREPAVATV